MSRVTSREADLVILLGRTNPTETDLALAANLLVSAPPLDFTVVRRLARLNKVFPPLRANLARLPSEVTGGLLAALEEETARLDLDRGRDRVIERLTWALALLGEVEERVMAIKGLSLLFLLPDYRLRGLGDLDLLFPDGRGLSRAARILQRNGFQLLEVGEAPLVYRAWVEGEGRDTIASHYSVFGPGCKFDMHSHELIAMGAALSGIDFWKRGRSVPLGQGRVWVPSPEDALLLLLLHAVDHGYLTLKDLNDAHALLSEFGLHLDWDYLAGQVTVCRLDRLFSFILDLLARHYGGPASVPEKLRLGLRPAGALGWWMERGGLTWHEAAWPLRALTAGHLGAEYSGRSPHRHRPPALLLIARHVLLAAREAHPERWPGRLAGRLLRRAEAGPFFRPLPPRHFPVYLTEVTTELQRAWVNSDIAWEEVEPALAARGFDLISFPDIPLLVVRGEGTPGPGGGARDGGEIALSPAGIFLPTMNFTFTEDEFERLTALASRVIEAAGSVGA